MAGYTLRPATTAESERFSTWRYEAPFDWYEPGDPALYLGFDDDTFEGYLALVGPEGRAVGFVCIGAEARVAGQEASDRVVDLGMGVDPAITSSGVATAALPAVLHLVEARLPRSVMRVAIWAENDRAIATARRAGFTAQRTFAGPAGRPFVEMVRAEPGSD